VTPVQSRKIGRIFFLVMLGTMGVLLAWDAVMQFAFGLKHTVSWAIWEASLAAPVIPSLTSYIIGLFQAHLFWSGHADSQKEIKELKGALREAGDWIESQPEYPGDRISNLVDRIDKLLEDA
jgi:hypothetical protein